MNGKNLPTQAQAAQTPARQAQTVSQLIQASKPAFQMALGSEKMAEHFTRVALTLVRQNPTLAKCDGMSLLAALMNAAQLNLYVGGTIGQAYIIPYWSSRLGAHEAQFQIGYQGYIELFYRHQLAQELFVEVVHKNDHFRIQYGTERKIEHEPCINGDRGEVIGYYAYASLKSGARNMVFKSVAEIEAWRDKYSKADKNGKRGVWDTDFDAMAKKTMIKQVLKYMPKSVEMIQILEADESVKRPINEKELLSLDSLPNRFEIEAQAEIEPITEAVAEPVAAEPEPKPTMKAATKPESEPAHGIDLTPKRNELLDIAVELPDLNEAEEWITGIRGAQTAGALQNIESRLRSRKHEVDNETK